MSTARLFGLGCVCAACLGVANPANAAFVLTIDDPSVGGVEVTVTDNGAGDSSATVGSIVYNGAVGAFTVVVSTGTSKPLIDGEPQLLDLNSVEVSGATGGNLVISLTDTDYTGGPTSLQALAGGTALGGVDFDFFYDDNNTEFGGTSFFTSSNNSGTDFSDSGTSPVSVTDPYSLTIVADLTHEGGLEVSSFDAEIRAIYEPDVVVPVPAAVWLFGSGLFGLACIARRKKA